MSQLVTVAILNQQIPTDQIRQTRTLLEVIVSEHWTAWGKLGVGEEITDFLKRRPYCRARLTRRAMTLYKPINSEEQSLPFRRRKITAGWSSSWTLM